MDRDRTPATAFDFDAVQIRAVFQLGPAHAANHGQYRVFQATPQVARSQLIRTGLPNIGSIRKRPASISTELGATDGERGQIRRVLRIHPTTLIEALFEERHWIVI